MSYYSHRHSNSDLSWEELIILLMLIFIISAVSKSCSRSNSHMIYIGDGYSYNEDSGLIYIEQTVGRYDDDIVFTLYYNEDGYRCRYNPSTGEWIPDIIKEEEVDE